MFLSRIYSQGRMPNAYEWHRELWKFFPNIEKGQTVFMYQVEYDRHGLLEKMYVLSKLAPQQDVTPLPKLKLEGVRQYDPLMTAGQLLRFKLVANPVKTIKDKEGRKNNRGEVKSVRVPLIDESQQREWLERRIADCAELVELYITPMKPLYFRKAATGAGKIVPTTFEGVIRVTDAVGFKQLQQTGIGPAKAFGCGLLLVRPI